MINQFFVKRFNLTGALVYVLLVSCNSTGSAPANRDSVSTPQQNRIAAIVPNDKLFNGTLDTLWTDVSAFFSLREKSGV